MAVQGPGELTVDCDECETSIELSVTEYAGTPTTWGVDESDIEAKGWIVDGEHTYCKKCAKKLDLIEEDDDIGEDEDEDEG